MTQSKIYMYRGEIARSGIGFGTALAIAIPYRVKYNRIVHEEHRILGGIKRIQQEVGITFVHVTHDQEVR